jgi:hypothetical protein
MNFEVLTPMNIETPSLKTEAAGSSRKLVTINWTVQPQIQKAAVVMKYISYPPPKRGAWIV